MTPEEEKEAQAQGAEAEAEVTSLLEQAIVATKQTERSRAQELLETLTEEALKGTVTWNKNVSATLTESIGRLDSAISRQLSAVMHHPKFQQLEGSWRGLHHLVMNSKTGKQLKIRMMNLSKKDLQRDLERAVEFDQSQMFKKIYEGEFGQPGGEPYGALIGDYEFTSHPDDIGILNNMSGVAATALCPFISAASPNLFGFESWTELAKPRDLEKIFESEEYVQWRSLRDSEDSRYLNLVLPRTLARLPYGQATKPIEEFVFEEFTVNEKGDAVDVKHDEYCWMNAAYVHGAVMTEAFSETNWCTRIRGEEGGGKVEGLPAHIFMTDDGDKDLKCPTEIAITDRRENELSNLGFLPLSHYKNTDFAVFFGAQSVQKPKAYDTRDATENAQICARLPYIMATTRFSHYLKVMARAKVGSFMEASDAESWLNRWILGYVNGNPEAGPELKAKFPLADAKVEVKEVEGRPGAYNAVVFLRPWLQMEELTASMRLVARIPGK